MKKINRIFIAICILGLLVGCSQKPQNDIQSYIQENFEYKSIKSVNKTVPPILGGKFNYYVSFIDKSDNDCFIIVDTDFNKYIMIYDNLCIEENSKNLQDKYKDLIDAQLKLQNSSPECSIKSELTDLMIKKAKSNLDMFKNGEIGEMHIKEDYIYKDKKKGEVAGPSQVKTIVLFDSETKQYYTIDEGNKP